MGRTKPPDQVWGGWAQLWGCLSWVSFGVQGERYFKKTLEMVSQAKSGLGRAP